MNFKYLFYTDKLYTQLILSGSGVLAPIIVVVLILITCTLLVCIITR